jgi:hypothetical protein
LIGTIEALSSQFHRWTTKYNVSPERFRYGSWLKVVWGWKLHRTYGPSSSNSAHIATYWVVTKEGSLITVGQYSINRSPFAHSLTPHALASRTSYAILTDLLYTMKGNIAHYVAGNPQAPWS